MPHLSALPRRCFLGHHVVRRVSDRLEVLTMFGASHPHYAKCCVTQSRHEPVVKLAPLPLHCKPAQDRIRFQQLLHRSVDVGLATRCASSHAARAQLEHLIGRCADEY